MILLLTDIPRLVYSLPPGELARARSLYHWRTGLDFGSTLWSFAVLLGLLNFRWFAGVGAWAASVTHKPWLQGFCFAPVILLLLSLFHLPLAVLGHHISLGATVSPSRVGAAGLWTGVRP